jgi:hypothetical protein
VSPGDTVVVGDGTYHEWVMINRGGTSSAYVTFKSEHPWGAVLAPTSLGSDKGTVVITSSVNYVTIQDFEITAPSDSNYGVRAVGGNIHIIGNKIHGIGTVSSCNYGGAISTSAGSGYVIDRNWVYDVSPPRSSSMRCNKMHGMYLQGTNTTVTNNLIFEVWQGWALQTYNPRYYVVANNTFFNNGDSRKNFGQSATGGVLYLGCDPGYTCSNNTWTNNIMMDNTASGYYCLYENDQSSGAITGNTYSNNLTYNCGVNNWATGSLVNNSSSNPIMMNYANDGSGDYHLSSSSPAVDHGTSSKAPPIDMDKVARPQGSANDIGAYEYKP